MINHFRTVLLNLEGPLPQAELQAASSIYIPKYRSKDIPQQLQEIEYLLFGDCLSASDKTQKTYQLLKLVHGSDLKQEVFKIDSRITYDVQRDLALEEYLTSTSLVYSIEKIKDVSELTINRLFSESPEAKYQYLNGGTYVDTLSAIVVAYVQKLGEL